MAKTLMETLQSSLSGSPQQPGMQDQGAQVQGVLRAKLGKAAAPGGAEPRASAIQEEQAVQQARLGGIKQQAEGSLIAEGLKQEVSGQQAKEAEQVANLDERREEVRGKFALQSDDIAQELGRGLKELDSKGQQQKLEQAGFLVRMQNDKYVTDLKNAAAKARIVSDRDFRIQAARSAFSDDESILKDQAFMQSFIDADKRQYETYLKGLDLKHEIYKMKQANKAKQISMVTGGVSQVVSGASSYGANK